ncbi:MAG: dipeptide/oligopeptide/nickel ABC transporter permease/ATP-binding protein [Microbacterium sp.]|uniref:dipeptide/oligopeptide/nickel ABC transporter permease/ATP-binding protein n=1 Tax=Microbacterium sp. TaxID=51671 RepID=UPI0039E3525B
MTVSAALTDSVDPAAARRGRLLWRFLRRPAGAISLGVLALIVLVAVLAPLLSPYDPTTIDLSSVKAPPSATHLLGTDTQGRDILSRLVWGTQQTLYGALVAIVFALLAGVPEGVLAGYFGGPFDRVATWVSDAIQSVPGMIILLIVAAGTGSDFTWIMATIGVFMAPGYFRLTRATVQSVREEPYIAAARVSGLGHLRIMSRHVLTAVYAPVIIQTALAAGMAMGMQAGLQFLGIGSGDTPSWGAMMNEGFRNMLSNPILLLWPSLALGITIAALAVAGSTLADVVSVRTEIPRRRRRAAVPAPVAASTGTIRHAAAAAAVQIADLRVSYPARDGEVEVVHGISLDVAAGEVVGIVGESGSGKSQTVFSVLGLLPPAARSEVGALWIDGRDVSGMTPAQRRRLLGRTIGYIPQEPMSNLDPNYTIGHQLIEPLRSVSGLSRDVARRRAIEVLTRVGIPEPERVMRLRAHEVSGGMAQRVLIAGAIAGKPSVLVADEPTTALDVTVQAEVLELLRELQAEYGMALLIVTHNFGVVADICDRVVVMKDGSVVETGGVDELFAAPAEPYTRELIAASLDAAEGRAALDAAYAASREGATVAPGRTVTA